MTQGPEDPHIPTLTQVVKPATRPRTQDSSPPGTLPPPTEPVVPSPGTLPPDLDIDFSLEALDEPGLHEPEQEKSISLVPPGFLEALQPPATPRPQAPEPALPSADLRAQIEAAVDEALAAQLPALRERLVDAVLKSLNQADS